MDTTSQQRLPAFAGKKDEAEKLVRVDRAIAPGTRAAKAAKRWYKAFREIAYQTPFPMVTSNPKWSQLPDWYRDALIAAMELYLIGEDADANHE